MNLLEAKQKLDESEKILVSEPVAVFSDFKIPHGILVVFITERLRKNCRKGRVWKSKEILITLKNAAYGFNVKASKSIGGADGIFRIDRNFNHPNSMMKKLFTQFIDKPDPLVSKLSNILGSPIEDLVPVRLVSHHMRLLGLLSITDSNAQLVLVDYDNKNIG